MTCKRTKNAKEDLAYAVQRFLHAKPLERNVSRSPTDSHTQTVAGDQTQVISKILIIV